MPMNTKASPRRGVFVPLVTPLSDAGEVCRDSVQQLMATCSASALGFVPCLTSGEGWRLSQRQWSAMLQFTLEAAQGRPVIAGIERPTTGEVLVYAGEAAQLGAKAIMLTSPFGGASSQADIFEHYRRVHAGCGLDLYIYNESTLSGNTTGFDTLLAIAELPRVVGIKDSAEGGRDAAQIEALRAHGLAYYAGWEQQLATGLPVDGCVVSLANLEPALCRVALLSAAPAVAQEVARLSDVYALSSDDWYRHVKAALRARGVIASNRTVDTP
jgi:4-hydroxy-tetrahydrodipicolinate synthase